MINMWQLILLINLVPFFALAQKDSTLIMGPSSNNKNLDYVKIISRTSYRYGSQNYVDRNMRIKNEKGDVLFEMLDDSNNVLVAYLCKPYVYSESTNLPTGDSILKMEVNWMVLGNDASLPDKIIVSKFGLRKNGYYHEYFSDGSIKTAGNYKDGLKSGRWIYYDDKGQFLKKEWYRNDKLKKSKIYK